MKLEEISRDEIKDGDIIYIDVDNDVNNQLLGCDSFITDSDVIFIIDDCSMSFEGSFLTNGGHDLQILKTDVIYKIGHYSELIKQLTK